MSSPENKPIKNIEIKKISIDHKIEKICKN